MQNPRGWTRLSELCHVDRAVVGRVYRIFGDAIYPQLPQLVRMFRNTQPHSMQRAFNDAMTQVRVSVEWGFNLVTNSFQAVDFIRWQRMFMTTPARQYRIATLLTNCLNCLRGRNQVSDWFDCPMPSIEDYVSGDW